MYGQPPPPDHSKPPVLMGVPPSQLPQHQQYPPQQGYPPQYMNQQPQYNYIQYPPPSQHYTPQHHQQYPPQHQYSVSTPTVPSDTNNVYIPSDAVQPGIPLYGVNSTPTQQKFVTRGPRDVWAAVLFSLVFIGVLVGGVYNMATTNISLPIDLSEIKWLADINTIITYVCTSIVSAVVLSALSIGMFQLCAYGCIIFAYITIIIYFVAAGIFMILFGNWMASIMFFLIAALRVYFFYAYRSYIPISAAILRRASILSREYPGTSIFNILMMVVLGGWVVFWLYMLIPTLLGLRINYGIFSLLALFSLFAIFWTEQVLSNVSHMTTSGVTATWYFCSGTGMPNTPTISSFKRAITTSFGSVCLGSLIVAILQLIRAILRSSMNSNGCGGFCAACAYCLISCIESLVRLFNKFAYVYCAMYGYSFTEAAKATFDLVKRSAFEALWNNILTETTLMLFSLLIGILIGVIVGVIERDILEKSIFLGVITGLIGIAVSSLIFKVIDSAVTTIFVCLAEEPQCLMVSDPQFYAEMTAAAERCSASASQRGGQSDQHEI